MTARMQSGDTVAGRIQLEELLGQGAMASVWRGRYLASGASVAVKVLHPEYVNDAEMRQRFVREGETLARVKAPGVPQVYEAGDDDGRPFLVLRCVDGVELETMLMQRGRLDLGLVRELVTQLGATLAVLHRGSIVHRDVKPSNILVRFDRDEVRVTLVDFGVAAFEAGGESVKLTQAGTTVGTPFYMSPEQALSATIDHRSDLWATAVVAYECLTGRMPFDGQTFGALCVALDRRRFTPVCKLRPELPRALDTWFARSFRSPGAVPFTSAAEMAEAFEASCAGREVVGEASFSDLPAALAGVAAAERAPGGPPPVTRSARTVAAMAISCAIGALGFGVATAAGRHFGAAGGAPQTAQVASPSGAQVATPSVRDATARDEAAEVPASVASAVRSVREAAPRGLTSKRPGAEGPGRAGGHEGGGASLSSLEAAAGRGESRAGAGRPPREDVTGEELDQRREGKGGAPGEVSWLKGQL
jgi:eukaryotic-like serine/threonine-protein kinase